MLIFRTLACWVAAFILTLAPGAAWAKDTQKPKTPTAVVSGVHQCCGGCAARITKLVTATGAQCQVTGTASGIYPEKRGKVTITASSDDGIRKAITALAAGGFHGTADNKAFAMPDDSGLKMDGADTVSKLEITAPAVCCNKCTKALSRTVKKISGVSGNTIKKGEPGFTVSGSFKAQELVKALNDAGFHVKVKK